MSNVITKEWMDAHDAAVQGKLQPLADALVIKTLASAPTGTTLTYSINAVSHNFKIGDEVRVADSNAETGYTYYKLYDIKNGAAVWGILGSGDGGGSTPTVQGACVRINLQAIVNGNVTSGTVLNGATVSIRNITDNTDFATNTWDGNELICNGLTPSKRYQFTVSAVNGFITPATYTTPVLNEGEVLVHTFQYTADGYQVVIDSDQEDKSGIASARITYNNVQYANGSTIYVPVGTTLTADQDVTATDLKDFKYRLSLSISGHTITAMYTLLTAYVDMGNGVLWATSNLTKDANGNYKLADNDWEAGAYFSWGDIEGHNVNGQHEGYTFNEANYQNGVSGNGHNLTISFSSGDPTYDAARAKLGGLWRVPTREDFQWLKDNCTLEYVNDYARLQETEAGYEEYVGGMIVTSNINGATLFFPKKVNSAECDYWTNEYEVDSGGFAIEYWFRKSSDGRSIITVGSDYVWYNNMIRPVQ